MYRREQPSGKAGCPTFESLPKNKTDDIFAAYTRTYCKRYNRQNLSPLFTSVYNFNLSYRLSSTAPLAGNNNSLSLRKMRLSQYFIFQRVNSIKYSMVDAAAAAASMSGARGGTSGVQS